jgi:hypothetical protein
MPPRLVKKVSVKSSSSSRVAWCPMIMKFPKNLQLFLVYKNYSGKLSFQQLTGPRSNHKVPFGQVAKCEYTSIVNSDGDVSEYFNFSNMEGQKVQFNVNILNFLTAGVSPVNQILAELRTEQKMVLISNYLSLLTKSVRFGLHRPDLYSELGFRLDGNGVTEESLKKAGGSLQEYETFLKLALASAHDPPNRKRKEAQEETNKTDLETEKDNVKSVLQHQKLCRKLQTFLPNSRIRSNCLKWKL